MRQPFDSDIIDMIWPQSLMKQLCHYEIFRASFRSVLSSTIINSPEAALRPSLGRSRSRSKLGINDVAWLAVERHRGSAKAVRAYTAKGACGAVVASFISDGAHMPHIIREMVVLSIGPGYVG